MVMAMVVLLRGRDSIAGAGPLGQSRQARYARLPAKPSRYSRVDTGLIALAAPIGKLIAEETEKWGKARSCRLHDLLPRAVRVAVLVNPADAANTASTLRDVAPSD